VNEPLVIPDRYCGPPTSGNGGYVSGALAHYLVGAGAGAVTVSLRKPPPLDVPMPVVETDAGVELRSDDALVARAATVALDLEAEIEPVTAVSQDEAVEASKRYPGHTFHPFPTCFSCGVDRPDGLRIFPGPVDPAADGRTRVAAPWTPDESIKADWHEYADASHRACLAATWAALDCIGGWAGDLAERLMVLGQMTAIIDALPVIGEPHVVMGRAIGTSGRKTTTASTLHDADGRIVGRAEHVWISVDPAMFGGRSGSAGQPNEAL
jgi:hypothetical protein